MNEDLVSCRYRTFWAWMNQGLDRRGCDMRFVKLRCSGRDPSSWHHQRIERAALAVIPEQIRSENLHRETWRASTCPAVGTSDHNDEE